MFVKNSPIHVRPRMSDTKDGGMVKKSMRLKENLVSKLLFDIYLYFVNVKQQMCFFLTNYLYTENMNANLSFAAMNLRKNLRKQFPCKGRPSHQKALSDLLS